ncbi:C25 family cysteine peptidase [Dysgonomonas sp. 520]|uniref:C25 family cysteine peptidase n=1 Tax=Dysgonomonas sp. 520 TaxID=2302931 RepID=UPI0013D1A656|nr:C25 family cysteine peptidase [Dysgonomonas sp. 520]NDW08127.1 hypothetical protein [Dysgonomonas sp. 520]
MKKSFLLLTTLLLSMGLFSQVGGRVNFAPSELEVISYGEFVRFSLPNTESGDDVGTPELPYVIQSFIIPTNANVTGIRINTLTKRKLPGAFYVYPSQPPIPVNNKYEGAFRMDTVLYNTQLPFPNKPVSIVSDHYELGYRIVTVGICPIEYIPRSKEVYLCNIDFSLEYSATVPLKSESEELSKQSQIQKDFVKKHIKAIVQNPDDVERFYPSTTIVSQSKGIVEQKMTKSSFVKEEIVPRYIIITNNELKPIFQELADWKTKKGVPTIIKTTEEIIPNYKGVDVPEKIRNYLIEARSKWGTGLFVLLGGNTDIIPGRIVSGYPTDLYYATTRGTWYSGNRFSASVDGHDFYLGRAPVKDIADVQTFIKKILTYEKAKDVDREYYNNFLVACAHLDRSDCISLSQKEQIRFTRGGYEEYLKTIKHVKETNLPSHIKEKSILMYDNFDCSGTKYNYKNYNDTICSYKMSNGSVIEVQRPTPPYSIDCPVADIELNKINFYSLLQKQNQPNKNIHIVYHLDHSSISSIGASSKDKGMDITKEDIFRLNNENYLQIMYSAGCKPATFNYDCFGANYLNNSNGGCVAFIGNSDDGYYYEHDEFARFIDYLYNDTTCYNLGYVFRNTSKPTNTSGKRRLTLLGDPEMPVWTATPQNLNVTANATPSTPGKTNVAVTINGFPSDKKAMLCIMKGNEAYMAEEVTGAGPHRYEIDSYTKDSIDVTVTSHNYIPFTKRYADSSNYNTNVSIDSLVFYDSNGDKQLDAGETIELTVRLKNTGSATVNNVSATLNCTSSHIIMQEPLANFGNIVAGGTNSSLTKYKFKIKENAPEILKNDTLGMAITFRLDIKDAASANYYDKFNIEVHTHKIEVRDQTIINTTNNNKIIEPGEVVRMKVDVFNAGKAETAGLKAQMIQEPPIVIFSGPCTYPNIKYQETMQNNSEFTFSVSNSYITGSALNIRLAIANAYGRQDTLSFNLLDKPGNILFDNIKFESDKTEIALYWNKPLGNFTIQGYNIYRSDTENGTYTKVNTYPVPHTYFKDYNLQPLKKYYYKISAVSNSGNEGNQSGVFTAWTTPPASGLFPVTMNISIPNSRMIAPIAYDVDNDGKKEIFTAMAGEDNSKVGHLIGLNHEGKELFDVDNNVTTTGEFSNLDAVIRAPVAIGDLYGTGKNYIVSVTRENYGNQNYITVYGMEKDENNRPRIEFKKILPSNEYYQQAPILANIDNSPDGSMEIILHSDIDNNLIKVLDNRLEELWCVANPSVDKWNAGAPVVADIDNDGRMEIIAGCREGIYIWDCYGKRFIKSGPPNYDYDEWYYSSPGYSFHHTPVVCDLYNNGQKKIIMRANRGADESYIHVTDYNANLDVKWGKEHQKITNIGNKDGAFPFSVGNLTGTGGLEIVASGKDALKVWDSNGNIILNKSMEIESAMPPILADLDGDEEIEILIAPKKDGKIYGLKLDGSDVAGFPIQIPSNYRHAPYLSVADIDGDGNSEIMAVANGVVYVWKTNGNANRIEWGSSRHNAQNTGEHGIICPPLLINTNTQWNNTQNICGNIIIESGKSLTLESNAIITMEKQACIIVKEGASLIVNGGKIYQANVKALSGSNVQLKNNAYIKLRHSGQFEVQLGAVFENQYGTIDKY